MTEKIEDEKSVKKHEKRQQKTREESIGGVGGRGLRAKYQAACQCGGLMVGVPRLQAISLCYQVK